MHDFIGNKGFPFWNSAIVINSERDMFSVFVPITSASAMSGIIGASSDSAGLHVRYLPLDTEVMKYDDVANMAHYFSYKLALSDTVPGLRFVDATPVATKYWIGSDWCVNVFINDVFKGIHCSSNAPNIPEHHWTDIAPDYNGGGDDFGGNGGGGGGGTGGGNPPTPPEDDIPKIPKVPCSDLVSGKANPLRIMQLAPPSAASISGATFGMTRKGGTKMHSGIDIVANVGTPVYAMFDGVIDGKFVTEQPNRGAINKYPSEYKGDVNDGGNRIYIRSTVNGKTIMVCYMHLRAGGAVAQNTNKGRLYQLNDEVKAGTIVGYTGITGNANAGVPHLHYGVKDYATGKWINPAPYLNATISTYSVYISTPCD